MATNPLGNATPAPVPKFLRRHSNGEYAPPPLGPVAAEAARRVARASGDLARRAGMSRRAFLQSSAGTAAALLALGACSDERNAAENTGPPAGRFDLPQDAAADETTADEATAPARREVIVDVQTHFLDPDSAGFGSNFPQAGCGDDPALCFTIDRWADLVLHSSDTSIAVLSALPIVAVDSPMSVAKMAEARRLADALCGQGRVFLQGEAFPQVGRVEDTLDRMEELARAYPLSAWKTYTHIGPAYSFTDDKGEAFLAKVAELGATGAAPAVVAVHKGLGADPADLGPAAAAHPEITFVAYHSGYEADVTEGPFDERGQGVDRLIRSLRDAGVGPGGNVYAELGSTWFNLMRDPDQAAHVLGKLLVAVGPERILWGTDSVWYGSPQDQITAFRAFTIGFEAQEAHGYPPLDEGTKLAIFGANAAALHGFDLSAVDGPCRFTAEERSAARSEALGRLGPLAGQSLGPTTASGSRRAFLQAHPWFFPAQRA